MSNFVDDAAEFVAAAQPDHDCPRDPSCTTVASFYLLAHDRGDGTTIVATGAHQVSAEEIVRLLIQTVERVYIDTSEGQVPAFVAAMQACRDLRDALNNAELEDSATNSLDEFLGKMIGGEE